MVFVKCQPPDSLLVLAFIKHLIYSFHYSFPGEITSMKKWSISVLMASVFLFENTVFASKKIISDSLVQNLNCQSLSLGSMLGSIRPEAFSHRHHMPFKNWPFQSGVSPLAACWGLSSTQRKLFYLLRHGEKNASPVNLLEVLDMIRGAHLKAVSMGPREPAQHLIETRLKNYSIMTIAEDNIRDEYGRNTGLGFLDVLLEGASYKMDRFKIHRNFRSEVERSQERHFFRFQNLGMGAGSGLQRPELNLSTLQTLKQNLRLKRLTLLNLRLRATTQHIVVAKSLTENAHGDVQIQVYDSNQPDIDAKLSFKKSTGHFYAPEILGIYETDLMALVTPTPIGVFIVDEEERTQIEEALLKHYQELCRK